MLKCEECDKEVYCSVLPIDKQVAGEFVRLLVCPDCYRKHQESLAWIRENFKRQFGDK